MENENIIYMAGEDGEELGFQLLDLVSYEGKQYAILLPVDEEDEGLVIQEVEQGESEDEVFFTDVMDDTILDAVYDIYEKEHEGEFEG